MGRWLDALEKYLLRTSFYRIFHFSAQSGWLGIKVQATWLLLNFTRETVGSKSTVVVMVMTKV